MSLWNKCYLQIFSFVRKIYITGNIHYIRISTILTWVIIHIITNAFVGIAFKTLRPRQNGRRFQDNIFKCIFFNENVSIVIKISLKFVLKGPINNIPALVQIMAWRRLGDKLYLNQWWLVYRRIYASLSFNELISISTACHVLCYAHQMNNDKFIILFT